MRLTVLAVGRLKSGPEQDLCKRYEKRLDATGRAVALGPLKIIEHVESRAANAIQRKSDEADRLLKSVDNGAVIVALDEHGKHMTSETFASWIAAQRDDGTQHMAFVVGGPDGLAATTLKRATLKLSLSALTMPHGLARVHLVEQLYRAVTILSGHPYHRV
ncbi:MAG: 23S rRNA (pseudouridine(1915)-N(3))-methyltransferase RlmH [Hyphomicrobiaceae bacterium]